MKKSPSAFAKLFLSYTAVLLLPMLLVAMIQLFTSRNLVLQNKREYDRSLSHLTSLISATAYDVQTLCENIIFDREIRNFINCANIQGESVSDLYQWKDALTKYRLANSNIKELYLYSSSSGWILSDGAAVKLSPTFFEATLGFTGFDYSQWLDFVMLEGSNGYCLFPSGEMGFRMNILSDTFRRCVLLVRIDRTLMLQTLEAALLGGDGTALIADADGNVLLSIHEKGFPQTNGLPSWAQAYTAENASAPDGYTAFAQPTFHEWQVIALVPDRVLNNNVRQLSAQIVLLAASMLVLGVILCLILSKNNAEPLKRIVASLSAQIPKEYLDNQNEYMLIENTMVTLLKKNSDYRNLNDEQRDLLDFELTRCLLMGEYRDLRRMERLMSHSHLPLEQCTFGVVAIHTGRTQDDPQDVRAIQEAMDSDSTRLLSLPDRYVALFFLPQDATGDAWLEQCHTLCLRLNACADRPFRLCVSGLCARSEEIHAAYDETVAMMEIMRAGAEDAPLEMHFSSVTPALSETFYDYPIDMELQIIHALKIGNTAMVTELLNEVRAQNFADHKLSAFMVRQLLFEMRGTIIRGMRPYAGNEHVDRHLRKMCGENTLDGLFQCIEDLSDEMAEILRGDEDRRDDHLEEAIYTFLLENYTNANLSLVDLVAPLGLSERFLYDFIRERFNSTFAKLLEALRITKACSLLRDGEASIKDVAIRVGYNNDHTFRLAFKRMMDVTPSEYLSAHQRQKSN